MESRKKITIEKLRFHKDDIVLVSMPTKLKNLYTYIGVDGRLWDLQAQKDKVFEFAILNKDETRFVLLRELEQKIICEVNDFVPKNSTGEFDFKRPTFVVENKNDVSTILSITPDEMDFGIGFNRLTEINKNFIKFDIQTYEQEYLAEKAKQEGLQLLNKCREYYRDF